MADRYWVGGTGTWNTTNTTNRSTSSGGSGGASVPTSADNVFFDQNTTYTVSVTGALACLSLDVSQGTVTFNNAAGTPRTLAVSGSFTIKTGTVWSTTAVITFNSTTSQTITTNGVTLSSSIVIDGSGGTFTLGSALTCGGLTLTNGTFSTSASNYNLTGNITISANSNTKQLDLNASTVTSGFANNSTGNFTLNEGTSTFVLASNRSITGTAETFYNITATNFGSFGPAYSGLTINGSTFNNGTFTTNDGRTGIVYLSGNPTFNGTLTTTSTNPWDRVLFCSSVPGTTRTITATTRSLTDADFQDITAGGGTSWTGTRLGDGGGNSNITFPASKSAYYVAGTAGNYASSAWSTSSGGSTSSANYPLIHDTAYFDDNSGTGTFFTGEASIASLTFANRTTAITWNCCPTFAYRTAWFGDIILSSAVTPSSDGYGVNVRSRSTNVINGAGKHVRIPPYIFCDINGVRNISLTGDVSFNQFSLAYGTFKLGSYTLTQTQYFSTDFSNTRTLDFGTGKILLDNTPEGGGLYNPPWRIGYTGLTVTGTPLVEVAGTNNFSINNGSPTEAQSISFSFISGSYSLTLSGRYRNLSFTGFSGTLNNAARTIYGNFTASSGMTLTAGANAQTFAATSGSKTITSSGKTFDFPITFDGAGGTWVLQDNLSMGSTRSLTHTNGTLDLNGKTSTVGTSYTTASGTKNLTFNGGTLVCPNSGTTAFNNAQPTNFTTTAGAGTGKISMTSASAKTFVGGGSTYNCTLSNDGAGALTIDGSNTFTTLANGVQPTTFTFASGSVTTLTNWSISGTSGNLVTIGSTTTSVHTLVKSSGTVNADYLSISYSRAIGGATWNAGANSVDGGNNQGWFGLPVIYAGNFFLMFN